MSGQAPAGHYRLRILRKENQFLDFGYQTDWQGRRKIAERLTDKRVREYARRLIYMNAPEVLSDRAKAEMDVWIRDRVLTEDTTVPWNTIPKAMRETDGMLASATDSDAALLTDVRQFFVGMLERCAAE